MTIAIVGASLAGVRAAETLRSEGFDGRVVLIGDEPHLPYDRPPLSKGILMRKCEPPSLLLREEQFYADNGIELVLGRRAAALRAASAAVELDDGTSVAADQVLLCTGGRARALPVQGYDLGGVHLLRTLDDALALGDELVTGARVVVIGAGFIGAEVAASARTLGCDVTMLEMADRPLGRVLAPEICERYAHEHRQQGVQLHTGVSIDHLAGVDRVTGVVMSDGTVHPADVVVVGIGIVPNTELAQDLGLAVSNGIVVDELCRTGNPAVFAAGDVTNHPSLALGTRVRLENWQNAHDQGPAAAMSMLGRGTPYGGVMWFWSDQYDLKLQMAGDCQSTDDVVWRGELDSNKFCAFYLRNGVLAGAVAANRPKDVRAAMLLIAAGVTPPREALADPSVDIRKAAMTRS